MILLAIIEPFQILLALSEFCISVQIVVVAQEALFKFTTVLQNAHQQLFFLTVVSILDVDVEKILQHFAGAFYLRVLVLWQVNHFGSVLLVVPL